MKKFLNYVFALLIFATTGLMLVACNKDEHTHTYSSEWKYDETKHWHETTCGHPEAEQRNNHTFGDIIIDEAPTPIKNGHGHKTCSGCGLTIYNIKVEYVIDTNADVTLIFDVRGGEPIAPVTVKAGTTIDLTQYNVTRTDGADFKFEGWIVGGKLVESIKIIGDTVAHASYSCDDFLGKQIINLGRYPKTRVTDQTIINALDAMEFSDRNSSGYYEYQGEEYAKEICMFNSSFGYERGKAYYFKVEPITWIGSNGRWTTLEIIDFVDSYKLLEYLNGDFYNSLTAEEKAVLGETKLNADEKYKFYLWNVNTFASSHSSQSDKKLPLTDYALCKDDTESYKDDRFTTKYWLLNPLNYSGLDNIGFYNFDNKGDYTEDVTYMEKAGLLPCFSFDFKGVTKMKGDETIRVTFKSNGGTSIDPKVLIANEKYNLATPEKEGYKFVGWYKDEQLTQFVNAYNFSNNKDVTLYAKWEVKPDEPDVYNISYELNGGTFDSSITLDTEFLEGEVITLPKPKKDSTVSYNYKFDGWYLEKDFKTKVTSTQGMADNVKVYAKWIEEGIYFYIEYNLSNGESIVETDYPTKVLRAEGTMELPTAKYDGYVFIGWKERGYSELITSINTLRTGSVELTPYWVKAYYLTWNLGEGTLANENELPEVIYAGAPSIDFTSFVPHKEGYKFLYWNISWLSAGNKYGVGYTETLDFTDGFNLPKTSSTPYITAVYSQVFKLNLNLMGGNVEGNTDDITIDFGRTEGTITFKNPTKEGATLLGWANNNSCSSIVTYYDMNTYRDKPYFTVNTDGTTTFDSVKLFGYNSSTGSNDLYEFDTIYAIWDKVTISFNTGLDGVEKQSIVVNYKENINLGDAIYALENTNDLKFGGWFKDEDYSVKYDISTYFCVNTIVYAKWLSKLTVTLIFEDGTQEEQYIYEGETIDSINYRVGSGQYLGGVYFDEALTRKLSYSQMSNYKPKEDITLYVVRKNI